MRVSPIALALLVAASAARAQPARAQPPAPTSPDISVADLRARVERFAHDSMRGRMAGSDEALRGTEYIAAELRRLGLRPAGDGGTFFQDVPLGTQGGDTASTIAAGGRTFRAARDFAFFAPLGARDVRDTFELVYAGRGADTTVALTPEQVRGKYLLVLPTAPGVTSEGLLGTAGYRRYVAMIAAAAGAVYVVGGTTLPAATVAMAFRASPYPQLLPDSLPRGPTNVVVTMQTAEALFGAPLAAAAAGATGNRLALDLRSVFARRPGRNVVAVLPGRDPALRGQYVALGAHTDHIGTDAAAADHDSVRAYNAVVRPQGSDSPGRAPTGAEWARIRRATDSLRAAHGGPRPDSIRNGADDDASGAMALLEVAERLAADPRPPRRSILLVWHVGEEEGMLGARRFTDRPTVPRDSIVAQINLDMIGRGGSDDVTGETADGAPLRGRDAGYLQLVGARRLSTELGDLVERVNRERGAGFALDYALDADGHRQNIYCRSDHYMYARYGIPIVFLTTGGHRDYHQVTDEPQYINWEHYGRVTRFVLDLTTAVAELDRRPTVDRPRPDPAAPCRQ